MKKYPKVVQCDGRGQIVIPKEVRQRLGVNEGSGFYMYTVHEEGILLKKIPEGYLHENDPVLKEIKEKANKLEIDSSNIKVTEDNYKKDNFDKMEDI